MSSSAFCTEWATGSVTPGRSSTLRRCTPAVRCGLTAPGAWTSNVSSTGSVSTSRANRRTCASARPAPSRKPRRLRTATVASPLRASARSAATPAGSGSAGRTSTSTRQACMAGRCRRRGGGARVHARTAKRAACVRCRTFPAFPDAGGAATAALLGYRAMSDSAPRSPIPDSLAFERPLLQLEQKIQELRKLATGTHLELAGEIQGLEERLRRQTADVYAQLSPWERVNVARHADRPLTSDYVQMMLDDFVELHGDRVFGDD